MRFNFNFFRVFSKNRLPAKLNFTFSQSTVSMFFLLLLKEIKRPFERKMIKSLAFDNFYCHYDNLAIKTRTKMTTAITFSRQNDAFSGGRTT